MQCSWSSKLEWLEVRGRGEDSSIGELGCNMMDGFDGRAGESDPDLSPVLWGWGCIG